MVDWALFLLFCFLLFIFSFVEYVDEICWVLTFVTKKVNYLLENFRVFLTKID